MIPLCHIVPLDAVEVIYDFPDDKRLRIESRVTCEWKTGVEMEALTTVSVCALTVYDMCKSVDRAMEIQSVRLLEKTGGRSGILKETQRAGNWATIPPDLNAEEWNKHVSACFLTRRPQAAA